MAKFSEMMRHRAMAQVIPDAQTNAVSAHSIAPTQAQTKTNGADRATMLARAATPRKDKREESILSTLEGIFGTQARQQAADLKAFKWLETVEQRIATDEFRATCKLDPRIIYCSRTGQPWGTRHENQIQMLHRLYNGADLPDYIFNVQISDHWLDTSGDKLTQLASIDPIGFFVYATGELLAHHYLGWNSVKKVWLNRAGREQFLSDKARLFQALQKADLSYIIRANDAVARFLSLISPDKLTVKIRLPYPSLLYFADPLCLKTVAEVLSATVEKVIRHVGFTAAQFDQSHVIALRQKMGGRQNMASARKLRDETPTDSAERELRAAGITGFLGEGPKAADPTGGKKPVRAAPVEAAPTPTNKVVTAPKAGGAFKPRFLQQKGT